jgi:hypothetical protein
VPDIAVVIVTCTGAHVIGDLLDSLSAALDELETSLRGGAAVVLRSKSLPMIRQEI